LHDLGASSTRSDLTIIVRGQGFKQKFPKGLELKIRKPPRRQHHPLKAYLPQSHDNLNKRNGISGGLFCL
jgi:hypothetical protein